MPPDPSRRPACLAVSLLLYAATARAGAVDQTCKLDTVKVGDVTFRMREPRRCPPGDILVTRPGSPDVLLGQALWHAGMGEDWLPAVVSGQIVWVQLDGDRSLLRLTTLATGKTVTLGRGGFIADQLVRSGRYVAVLESRDPLLPGFRATIPHRMAVVDLAAAGGPALLPEASQPPWPAGELGLEHILDAKDAPGTFWFLQVGLGQPRFQIGRWRDGQTKLVVFDSPRYGSYAYLAIDPTCGLVAWNGCDALRDRAEGCRMLVGRVADGKLTPIPLPASGYVGRLVKLGPDGLTYEWVSHETYAKAQRTAKFAARCQP